jgi:hypothetical protein
LAVPERASGVFELSSGEGPQRPRESLPAIRSGDRGSPSGARRTLIAA